MNNPAAPINVESIAKTLNYKLIYDDLHGPAGLTYRKLVQSQWRYAIFIASDMNTTKYTPQQIKFRQRYTIAHEIGHILLHHHLDDWNNVTDEQKTIIEVEANWFASRLLMPNYAFTSIQDLDPNQLSQKYQVNYQAAQKRLNNLDKQISSNLIRQATDIASFIVVDEFLLIEYDFDWNKAYEEMATAKLFIDEDSKVYCFSCGNNNLSVDAIPLACYYCGSPLFE